jgi:hypothetical protein
MGASEKHAAPQPTTGYDSVERADAEYVGAQHATEVGMIVGRALAAAPAEASGPTEAGGDVSDDLAAAHHADEHGGGFAMRRSPTWRHVYYGHRQTLAAARVDDDAVEREAWALYPDDGSPRGSMLRTAFREGADAGARVTCAALAAARAGEAEPEHAEVAEERERQVAKGYDAAHDDRHGAYALARMAQRYVLRGLNQGNRSDFIKAAGLLESGAASFRRLGHPIGTSTEE